MMLIFGLCFLLTVTSNETPLPNVDSIQKPTEEQLQKIELLDFQISQEKEPQGTHMMDLRNERGLLFLLLGQYENSLNDFDHVLQSSSSTTNVAFEAALWGKLFADAYSSQEEAAFEDLWLIRSAYTQQCISCSKKTK